MKIGKESRDLGNFKQKVIKKEPNDELFNEKCDDNKRVICRYHVNEVFIQEVKVELFQGESLVHDHLEKDETTNINHSLKVKKIETDKSRERRLSQSKLYYKMKRAKEKGQHELLKIYELEKNKYKYETVEEREKRLEMERPKLTTSNQGDNERLCHLKFLLELQKSKLLSAQRKTISSQMKVDSSMIYRENKRKRKLNELLLYQIYLSSRSGKVKNN